MVAVFLEIGLDSFAEDVLVDAESEDEGVLDVVFVILFEFHHGIVGVHIEVFEVLKSV